MLERLGRVAMYVVLTLWLFAVAMPMIWIVTNSFRGSQEISRNPYGKPWIVFGVPAELKDEVPPPVEAAKTNYANAWVKSGFQHYAWNSVIVTFVSLAGIILFGSMASYVLARFQFRGNRSLYLYFISGLMVPAQLLLVPLFFQFATLSKWGSAVLRPFGLSFQLHDSLSGLIIIYIALSLPFTILVLTGFFKSLPAEMREAAIIDGCSEHRAFWSVMLPLARAGIISVAILNFIGLWNEYLFALVFVNGAENKTLPLGLANVSIAAQYKTDMGLMFAGLVIVMLPTLLIYLLLQRQLTKGITVGALK
jgi:N-acetylglucosamine transport system permease protein